MPAIRLQPGDTFAGYVVEEKLGEGGMGAVYKVRHPALKKSFALKILLDSVHEDPSFAMRFQREMETVSQLDHPNIVTTVDGGSVDGRVWFTMNYVPGTDAQHAIEGHQGLPPELVVHIVEKVCAALEHAYRKGIVHRDIKPANILLAEGDNEQRVFLTDFGIAKAVDDMRSLTTDGFGPMTIDYASPEQIRGEELDHRTDLYSLGATMFVLLTGRVPFPADSLLVKANKHLNEPPPVPSMLDPRLPSGFDDVIATAMTKDREMRFQYAAEIARAARAALASRAAMTAPNWSPPMPPPPPTSPAPPPTVQHPAAIKRPPATGTKRRRVLLVSSLAAALVLTVGGFVWASSGNSGGGATSSSSSAATTSSDPSNGEQSSSAAASSELLSSSESSPDVTTSEQPPPPTGPVSLADLLTPAPALLQGTLAGSQATEPGYRFKPKNCAPGSLVLTADLGGNYDNVVGQLQLDDDISDDAVIRFTAASDGTTAHKSTLTRTDGAKVNLDVSGVQNLVLTLESAGQGSCDADDYLVFLTGAIASPQT